MGTCVCEWMDDVQVCLCVYKQVVCMYDLVDG